MHSWRQFSPPRLYLSAASLYLPAALRLTKVRINFLATYTTGKMWISYLIFATKTFSRFKSSSVMPPFGKAEIYSPSLDASTDFIGCVDCDIDLYASLKLMQNLYNFIWESSESHLLFKTPFISHQTQFMLHIDTGLSESMSQNSRQIFYSEGIIRTVFLNYSLPVFISVFINSVQRCPVRR